MVAGKQNGEMDAGASFGAGRSRNTEGTNRLRQKSTTWSTSSRFLASGAGRLFFQQLNKPGNRGFCVAKHHHGLLVIEEFIVFPEPESGCV